MSTIHRWDIAHAMSLAMAGAMDGRIVNLTDDAPVSIYELVGLVGETMNPSSAPPANPWNIHVNGSTACSLGFQSAVRTVYQAMHEKLMLLVARCEHRQRKAAFSFE